MRRTIKKNFRFNRKEAQDLERKARKVALSEAAFIRLLVAGYEPREKPDDRFYEAMNELNFICHKLSDFVEYLKRNDYSICGEMEREMLKWADFQQRIEKAFLMPIKSADKW